ncbi:MAG: hypothetical protein MK186_03145, partial [Henriciella sp.]|nr:hypothetical protein [Henriciella sp.]
LLSPVQQMAGRFGQIKGLRVLLVSHLDLSLQFTLLRRFSDNIWKQTVCGSMWVRNKPAR